MLRDGGTAADALVTAQAVLGLVEPQASVIGGGGFLVYYDAASGAVRTFDGRETAFVGRAMDVATFSAAAREPHGKAVVIMVAAA